MIGLLAGYRICQLTIGLVTLFYLVEQGRFCCRIVGTKQLGALEHQMLQVVGQARRLGRVVLRARAHGDIGLNTRLVLIDRKIHLQSVVKRVDASLRQIALDGLVLVVFSLSGHPEREQACQ